MTGAGLVAVGHAALVRSHELILLAGVLGLLSILAGLLSRRVGAPMLLVFLALGMLAGDDHVLGIPYDDFNSAYLIGSVALLGGLLAGSIAAPTDAAAVAVLMRGASTGLPERLFALLEVESGL